MQIVCLLSHPNSNWDATEGKLSANGMWKMKKKLFKRAYEPPTAKRDAVGNIITSTNGLKEMYLQEFKNRLRHRKIDEQYIYLQEKKELLWKMRFNECKSKHINHFPSTGLTYIGIGQLQYKDI